MAFKRVLKAEQRIMHARSEYGEYTSPWHRGRKGGWGRYQKWMHSKALRTLASAIIAYELLGEQDTTVKRGMKRPETKRLNKIKWKEWSANWQKQWSSGDTPEKKLERDKWMRGRRRLRKLCYARLCQTRRTDYWRRFLVD